MNITYTKCGDYLLPNLKLTEKENKILNKYGLLRLEYLKSNKKALYQELLMKDKLNEHLFSVGINAENKVNHIINELIKSNISSLKIEGRMKSPEYVGFITKLYKI